MEWFNRWVAKHVWPVYIVSTVVLLLTVCVLMGIWSGVADVFLFLALLAGIFLCARFAFSRGNVLLKKPLAVLLHECDPYPYLQEAQEQQNYPGNSSSKLARMTTLASALQEVGEYDKAWELLRNVPTEVAMGAHPLHQVIYCNMMFFMLVRQEQMQEAQRWHQKLLECYGKIKSEKYKKHLDGILKIHWASYYCVMQEYAEALQMTNGIQQKNLRDRVVCAFSLAKIACMQGEKETAVKHLQFVIENGNKLYVVTEAKALLEKIQAEESAV